MTKLLTLVFEVEGWAVEVATSGWDFLVRLAESWPDVVVLDNRMDGPTGLTGLESAAIARDDGFDRPIILFSAHLDRATRVRADELGLTEVSKLDFPAIVRHVTALHQVYVAGGSRTHLPGRSGG